MKSSPNPIDHDGAEISFRPIDDEADADFLFRVYASTREEELAQVPWSDEQKEEFLRHQFGAQTSFYNEQFREGADFLVILVDGQAKGRLYLDRRSDEFRIIDITLLPDVRGRGIGGRLLGEIIREAAAAGKPVRIHVEQNNPAMKLYRRLGFEKIDEEGIYWLMERVPSPPEDE